MSKQKSREVLGMVCVGAQSVIAAALCLAGLLAALLLSAFLPGLWSLVGFTTVLLVASLPLLGKSSSREFLLESRLGVRDPDGEPLNGSGNRASVPKILLGGWPTLSIAAGLGFEGASSFVPFERWGFSVSVCGDDSITGSTPSGVHRFSSPYL